MKPVLWSREQQEEYQRNYVPPHIPDNLICLCKSDLGTMRVSNRRLWGTEIDGVYIDHIGYPVLVQDTWNDNSYDNW